MLVLTVTLVLLSAVLPAFTAPTSKPDVPLASDILEELKAFQSQFSPLEDEIKKIVELAIKKETHEQSGKAKEPAEKQRTQEKNSKKEEDFISRVAQTVASKLSNDDPLSRIERFVNITSNYLVAKINASNDNINKFQSKLLEAVIKILKERVPKHESPVNKTLLAESKDVDEKTKVSNISQLVNNKLYVPEASQKSPDENDEAKNKSRSFEDLKLPKNEDGVLFALLGHLEKLWHLDKKSLMQAKKQKKYLKGILLNTYSLMEKYILEAEQKQNNASNNTSDTAEEKEDTKEKQRNEKEHRKEIEREEKQRAEEIVRKVKQRAEEIEREEKQNAKEIEREEKQHAKEIEREEKQNAKEIEREEKQRAEEIEREEKQHAEELERQEKQNAKEIEREEKQNAKEIERNEKENSEKENQTVDKRNFISDFVEKKIAEVKDEIKQQQKEKEKGKEKRQNKQNSQISDEKLDAIAKQIEKELKKENNEKEKKDKEKSKMCKIIPFAPVRAFCKEGLTIAEKAIKHKLEEQPKTNITTTMTSQTTAKLETTAMPETTAKPEIVGTSETTNSSNEGDKFIKELDDLFKNM